MPAQLLAIVGPTGTGKSELAIRLAEALQNNGQKAEIVNADAMQLYKAMNI
ncbi:MAG: tRNA ((37)-N6)-dimethylallyltransferase MiaA, partial [Actinomycetota bacterium]